MVPIILVVPSHDIFLISFLGVQKVFDGVASSPAVVGEYSKKAVDQVKSSLKS